MALTDELTALTIKHFRPRVVNNIFNDVPLLRRFRERNAVLLGGGLYIAQPLMYAKTDAAGWYSGYDTLDTTPNEQFTEARYEWKQGYVNITIDRLTQLKNSGREQIINLVAQKMRAAQLTLADIISTALFSIATGGDADSLVGLRSCVDDATAETTYGNIDRSTYTWWKSNYDYNSGTARALTLALMEGMYMDCKDGMDLPTLIATTKGCVEKYWALLQTNERYVNTMMGNAGFEALAFNSVPVMDDAACPTDASTKHYMYFLNERYLELAIHQDENFRVRPFQEPENQNAATSKIFVAMNLTCSNCSRQGVIRSINPAL